MTEPWIKRHGIRPLAYAEEKAEGLLEPRGLLNLSLILAARTGRGAVWRRELELWVVGLRLEGALAVLFLASIEFFLVRVSRVKNCELRKH